MRTVLLLIDICEIYILVTHRRSEERFRSGGPTHLSTGLDSEKSYCKTPIHLLYAAITALMPENPRVTHKCLVYYRQISFHRVSLYCTSQVCVFDKLKVCGNPVPSESIDAIFPTAFAHFMSLRHILVIPTIFQTLHYYYVCCDL